MAEKESKKAAAAASAASDRDKNLNVTLAQIEKEFGYTASPPSSTPQPTKT